MNNLTDDKGQGASKKKIKARKPRTSPDSSVTNLNYEEDSYIPIASTDSQWNGIEFTVPKNENIEHMNCLSDVENEIQVIELENDENYPLLLLFPELKSEALNFQNILRREVSTSDVTKMLVGKKPNLALLKPCKKLNNKRVK
ncbi:hypothetical protein NQ315_003630 [Exocentrus adspersus]|uniref:Uncharacterized protein n=1 Tax=Exocentrus adspersus TaxID=1586481 RepID=A0AAV8VC49_9CUCU|nr:hypothetical protein NQ315_003630 [Exocentrus adspersus]